MQRKLVALSNIWTLNHDNINVMLSNNLHSWTKESHIVKGTKSKPSDKTSQQQIQLKVDSVSKINGQNVGGNVNNKSFTTGIELK